MASELKHTPGPWHRNIPPARKYPTVWAGRNTHIAAVVAGAPRGSGNGETMPDEEIEANINLIAAAPTILETGSALVDRNCRYEGPNIVIPCASHGEAIALLSAFRAAISRATQPAA